MPPISKLNLIQTSSCSPNFLHKTLEIFQNFRVSTSWTSSEMPDECSESMYLCHYMIEAFPIAGRAVYTRREVAGTHDAETWCGIEPHTVNWPANSGFEGQTILMTNTESPWPPKRLSLSNRTNLVVTCQPIRVPCYRQINLQNIHLLVLGLCCCCQCCWWLYCWREPQTVSFSIFDLRSIHSLCWICSQHLFDLDTKLVLQLRLRC